MSYNGKEVCQGCKVSGVEQFRWSKDSLCPTCDKIFKIGQCKDRHNSIEESFNRIFLHHHAYSNNEVSDFVHNILSILENKYHTKHGESNIHSIKDKWGGNGKYYKIPEVLLEPFTEFFNKLDACMSESNDSAVDEKVRKMLADVKNEYFNEGVEKGKNLLFQLNSGEITMDKFNDKVKKY